MGLPQGKRRSLSPQCVTFHAIVRYCQRILGVRLDCEIADVRKLLQKHRSTSPASVALALDAQVGLLPLDRVITEVNDPRPMFDDIGLVAVAGLNDRVTQLSIDVQLAVDLFGEHREVAIQPKQPKPDVSFHRLFPVNLREHEPVNSPCQIRELAA